MAKGAKVWAVVSKLAAVPSLFVGGPWGVRAFEGRKDGPTDTNRAGARRAVDALDRLSPALFAGSWKATATENGVVLTRTAGKLVLTVEGSGALAVAAALRWTWRVQRKADTARGIGPTDDGGPADGFEDAVKRCWGAARAAEGAVCDVRALQRPARRGGAPASLEAVRAELGRLTTATPDKPARRGR